MKALTIWQPWATLMMAGAKPDEFRGWDYRTRQPALEGQRIVNHAAARPMREAELLDIFERIEAGESALVPELALPILTRAIEGLRAGRQVLPLASGLGTMVLGTPQLARQKFAGKVADSDRIDEHLWGWPVSDPLHFEPIVPRRGAQGFWNW